MLVKEVLCTELGCLEALEGKWYLFVSGEPGQNRWCVALMSLLDSIREYQLEKALHMGWPGEVTWLQYAKSYCLLTKLR